MSGKRLKFNVKTILRFIACMLVLYPIFWPYSIFPASTVVKYGSIALAFVIAICVDGVWLAKWQISIVLPWLIFLLIVVLNRNADIQNGSISSVVYYLIIIVFGALFLPRNGKFMQCALAALLVYLLIELVGGFYFWFNPDAMLEWGISFYNLEEGDYYYNHFVNTVNNGAFMSLASHYSTSGMFMGLAVVLMAAYVFSFRGKNGRWGLISLIVFLLFFIALILTQKRGQLLFGAIAVLFMYVFGYIKGDITRRLRMLLIMVIVIVVAFVLLMQTEMFQAVWERFTAGDNLDEISNGRVEGLWIPAIEDFLAHPLFGIGWDQFLYTHTTAGGLETYVHNTYIQLYCENGVILGTLMVGYMFVTWYKTCRALMKCKYSRNYTDYLILLFSFGYQTFFLLYCVTGNPLYGIECFFPYIMSCCMGYTYYYKYRRGKKDSLYINMGEKYGRNDLGYDRHMGAYGV